MSPVPSDPSTRNLRRRIAESVPPRLRDLFGRATAHLPPGLRDIGAARALALVSVLALLSSWLVVLRDIVDAVGDPSLLWPVVAVPLVAGTLLAHVLRVKTALALATVLLMAGLSLYVASLPHDPQVLEIVESNVELLTGQSILRIERADVWALVVAPTPVFVAWYLALRRWYTSGALAGSSVLAYLVLTGDAGTTITLLGVVAAGALVGFGDLDRRNGSAGTLEQVAVVLAVMVVTPLLLTVVPGGAASPVALLDDPGGTTIESNVVTSGNELEIQGSIEQTPEVRFTVESHRTRYWRTGSFDRFTGQRWIRSEGRTTADGATLSGPPGRSVGVQQRIEARSELDVLPAAWRPLEVSDNVADRTRVTGASGLQLEGTLRRGERYSVRSAIPIATEGGLEQAGTDYPDHIEQQYTQLPASTPDRVGRQTREITARANTPYEQAVVIERYLEASKQYSLDVERPDGNIADAFLFEMEAGYCTYYATTMVTMLRSQGVPARLAVGYTPGEQVADDRHVVRGLDSHAWVEVYFPDVGWVQFDPTPADPREQAEQATLDEARSQGTDNVDTPGTEAVQFNETDEPGQFLQADENDSELNTSTEDLPTIPGRDGSGEPGGFELPDPPPRDQAALGAIVLVGAVAGLRQSGLVGRLRRGVRFRWHSTPSEDIERAHDRLLAVLAREHRPRRTGEPVRAYLDAIDADRKARRVAEIREQARYGGVVTPERADEALDLVDRLSEQYERPQRRRLR